MASSRSRVDRSLASLLRAASEWPASAHHSGCLRLAGALHRIELWTYDGRWQVMTSAAAPGQDVPAGMLGEQSVDGADDDAAVVAAELDQQEEPPEKIIIVNGRLGDGNVLAAVLAEQPPQLAPFGDSEASSPATLHECVDAVAPLLHFKVDADVGIEAAADAVPQAREPDAYAVNAAHGACLA